MLDTPILVDQSLLKTQEFIEQYYQEQGRAGEAEKRMASIEREMTSAGICTLTEDEVAYGAKVAWRNNTHCIGRLFWKNLIVRDMRHLQTAEEVFEALVEHIRLATNGGRIRPMITIFAPQQPGEAGIRIWNPQLIRYAGYTMEDGTILGDPLHADLTRAVQALGWEKATRTAFDVLPLVIQMPGQPPRLFELPPDAVLEVPIQHPDHSWFAELGLRWHALPAISNMRLSIGGLSFTAAPFNGWYMGTEIGARNFGDAERYNLLPLIARKLGLDTRTDRTLWKDRALVELNVAVLDSFAASGVTIIDHHTAARQLIKHEHLEKQADRELYASWAWMVPPMSGSTTPIFHRTYTNKILTPNFFYQEEPWKEQL